MKICLKQETSEIEVGSGCKVVEYPLNNEMLDIAIANIAGRYPDEKRVVNVLCSELVYVCEGTGKVVVNEQEHSLNTGDVVIIEPGEKYYWEGFMKLVLSCRPVWNKEQHQIVD